MNLVMCPNGHPNRPGATQCTICRAPIASEIPDEEEEGRAAVAAEQTATNEDGKPATDETATKEGSTRNGCGWLLGLLIVGLLATGAALLALFWPSSSTQTVSAPEMEPTAVVVVAEPTEALPASTDPPPTTAPLPTAPPPTKPPPTAEPEPTVEPEPTAEPEPTIEPTPASDNLIVNGDFATRWVTDWTRQADNINGIQVVEQRPLPDDPESQLLHMSKTGSGVVVVGQTIEVPSRANELQFLGRVRLIGTETAQGEPEGRAALMLIYEDADGERLGHSIWWDAGGEASGLWGKAPLPQFGPTTAPRFAARSAPEEWQTIDIRLQQEFVNRLPTVRPENVATITVLMVLSGSDECAPEACAATLEVTDLQFLPVGME